MTVAKNIYPVPENELPDDPRATHWAWQTGNRWVAVLEHEQETWWEGADPNDVAARPEPWFLPLAELPPKGTVVWKDVEHDEQSTDADVFRTVVWPSMVEYEVRYFIDGPGNNKHDTSERETANHVLALTFQTLAREGVPDDDAFEGAIRWYVDDVPASLYDELVVEYGANPHGDYHNYTLDMLASDTWSIDRNRPFLLVQINVRGGYWMSSHDSIEDAETYQDSDEYAEEWEIVELVELATGKRYHGTTTISTSFTEAPIA